MIKALTILLLASFSAGCLAIKEPTVQGLAISCDPPATRTDGQPIDISEMIFEITYGKLSDTGDGIEIHTTLGSDCYFKLPADTPPGEYHAYILIHIPADGTESQPIESDPFIVQARPNSPSNLEVSN